MDRELTGMDGKEIGGGSHETLHLFFPPDLNAAKPGIDSYVDFSRCGIVIRAQIIIFRSFVEVRIDVEVSEKALFVRYFRSHIARDYDRQRAKTDLDVDVGFFLETAAEVQ